MSITMHGASAPIFERQLTAMLGWLDKAQAHAEQRGFDPAVYLTMRLAPDMLAFPRQVQIACDAAKGAVARLGGVENPSFPDDEATLDALRARVQRTLDFVLGVPADAVVGSEARAIEIPMRTRAPLQFEGEAYLKHFALPNFFFHCSMTYALLRHAGVPLGKADFLGG